MEERRQHERRGRPRKPANLRLSAMVSFACTDAEEARLIRLAKASETSVSAYIRLQLKTLGILI